MRLNLETNGNLIDGLSRLFGKEVVGDGDDRYHKLFGIRYAQYIRFDFNLARKFVLAPKTSFVFRFYTDGDTLTGTPTLYRSNGSSIAEEATACGDGWRVRSVPETNIAGSRLTPRSWEILSWKPISRPVFPCGGFCRGPSFSMWEISGLQGRITTRRAGSNLTTFSNNWGSIRGWVPGSISISSYFGSIGESSCTIRVSLSDKDGSRTSGSRIQRSILRWVIPSDLWTDGYIGVDATRGVETNGLSFFGKSRKVVYLCRRLMIVERFGRLQPRKKMLK